VCLPSLNGQLLFGDILHQTEERVQEINETIGVNYVCRIIYNYPAVSGGIDLSSDDVVDIANAAPNVCGIMLSYERLHFALVSK
jgi:hypothetical protein